MLADQTIDAVAICSATNTHAPFVEQAAAAARVFGLDAEADEPATKLSYGNQRRLEIARALATKPKLLLLDEHTAALDPKSADQIIQLSDKVIARDKLTTLMVTHSMQQAVNLGDRLIMMHRGRIIHDFQGAEKRRLKPGELLELFEDIRRADQLDESAAEMLSRVYV